MVPARVAAWLAHYAQLDKLRSQVRGSDPEVDSVLVAITVASLHWRASATGSTQAPIAEVGPPSEWMSTTQAAEALDITPRAVTLAIADHRLPAERVGSRWVIRADDVEHYRATREAAGG